MVLPVGRTSDSRGLVLGIFVSNALRVRSEAASCVQFCAPYWDARACRSVPAGSRCPACAGHGLTVKAGFRGLEDFFLAAAGLYSPLLNIIAIVLFCLGVGFAVGSRCSRWLAPDFPDANARLF